MTEREVVLVLIGPPGAGKSTIGGLLARRLDLAFVDTDMVIEERTKRRISDIFVEDGEETFRAIEEQIVLETLENPKGVIALGGGSILAAKVQEELRPPHGDRKVLYLDVSISNAAPRVGFNKERPLLMINPRAQWQELMNKRRPIYLSLADEVIDTNNLTPDEVVDEILKRISR